MHDSSDRYPSNHRIGMVKIDKIVSEKDVGGHTSTQPTGQKRSPFIDYLIRLLWRLGT